MGNQQKIILGIVAILAILAAAGVGLRYGTDVFDDAQVAEKVDEQKSVAVSPEKVEPEKSAEADADADVPVGPADAPSFDIVRVESTGELVAAGRASAGAHVELISGDKVLTQADANPAGEWAMVIDQPLAPGSYDLLLRATGEDGKGDMIEGDRVTVVIESPDRTPLVAVARPGEPMEVVQQPESDKETVVAEAPKIEAAEATEPKAEAPKAETPTSDAASAEAAKTDDPAAGDAQAGSQSTPDAASSQGEQSETQVTTAGDKPAATSSDQTAEAAPQQAGADTSTDQTVAAGASTEAQADKTQTAAAPAQTTQDQQGQEQLAQGQPAQGQSPQSQTAQNQTVQNQNAEGQAAEGENTDAKADQGQADQVQSAQAQPGPVVDSEKLVVIETFEVEEAGRLMLSGRADPGDAVRVYLNDDRLADVKTDDSGRWTLSADHPMPPGRYAVRADVVANNGDVTARAQVRFDRVQVVAEGDVPQPGAADDSAQATDSGQAGSTVTIVSRGTGVGSASSDGTVGAGAGTSVVVIARGDNLWHIARKIYGQGVRHSVIYEANRNQIRDPHLIYPGQVFTIPVLEEENGSNG